MTGQTLYTVGIYTVCEVVLNAFYKTETNSIFKQRVKRYLYIPGTVDTVLEHPLLRCSTSIIYGIEVNYGV